MNTLSTLEPQHRLRLGNCLMDALDRDSLPGRRLISIYP